jgi:hypothetical protein
MVLVAESIAELIFLLERTVFKKRTTEKLIEDINKSIQYNKDMIKLYKGEIKETLYPDECGICSSHDKNYLKKFNIPQELILEEEKTCNEAYEIYKIFEEECRKKNIAKRVEFLEKELIGIKKIIK